MGRADDEPLGAELERHVEVVGHARGHPARLGAEAVGGGDADQRGSPHGEAANGFGRLGRALAVEEDLLVRQAALVEEAQPPGRVRVRRHPRGGPGCRRSRARL